MGTMVLVVMPAGGGGCADLLTGEKQAKNNVRVFFSLYLNGL
jgi:hypothetical protein